MNCCDGGNVYRHRMVTFERDTECPVCEVILHTNTELDKQFEAYTNYIKELKERMLLKQQNRP